MSKSSEVSVEELRRKRQRQIQSDPRYYMRYNWRHPNDPSQKYDFRTNDGEPFTYITDDKGPLNPDEWANVNLLLFARGCLKTTSVLGITHWILDTIPNSEVFMTAPTEDPPIKEFVDKFKENLPPKLEGNRVRNRQSHQKFKWEYQKGKDVYEATTHLKTQTAHGGGETLRGPHCHAGVIDEFQDVDESAFSVFLEMIDREVPNRDEFPVIFLIGTPKMTNSFYHRMWKRSNQREWKPDEEEWEDQSDVGMYAPEINCDICGTPVGPQQDECPECDAEIEADLSDAFTIKGWHVDQYGSPLHDEGNIAYKRSDNSEKKFQNEVLANFYSAEDDLLSDGDVKSILYEDMGFRNSRIFDDSTVVFSVDWGGGGDESAADTTFTVGERVNIEDHAVDIPWADEVETNWFHFIIQHEFVDHDLGKKEETQKVREWITKYDPDLVLVDEGFGTTERQTLQEEYFDRLKGVMFGNVSTSEDINWNTNDADQRLFATVDKVYSSEMMVDTVKDGKFVLPKQDLSFGSEKASGNKLISQLTAPYKESKTTQSGKKKLSIEADRNDDAFDTFTYQHLGAVRMQQGPSLTSFSLKDRKGY